MFAKLPISRRTAAIAALLPSLGAHAADSAPVAEAQRLFESYMALSDAFDARVADLYAPSQLAPKVGRSSRN